MEKIKRSGIDQTKTEGRMNGEHGQHGRDGIERDVQDTPRLIQTQELEVENEREA